MKTNRVKIRGLDIRRYARAIALQEEALRPFSKGVAMAKHNAAFAVAVCAQHQRLAAHYDAAALAELEATAQRYLAMLDGSKSQGVLPCAE